MTTEADQIKTLTTSIETVVDLTQKAQERNDKLDAKNAEHDDELKAIVEAATVAAEKADEITGKMESVVKTAAFMEKQLARIGKAGNGGQTDEVRKAVSEATSLFLRTGIEFSDEIKGMIADLEIASDYNGMSDDDKADMKKKMISDSNETKGFSLIEQKSLIAGSNVDGGFWVRPELSSTRIVQDFETSPMRQISSIETVAGNQLDLIIDDDEGISGGWVGEVEDRPSTGTPKIGMISIVAHEQYAEPKATQTMLDDAGFNIGGWLEVKTTSKMTRTENTTFVLGDGSKKARGFLDYPAWADNQVYERFALGQRISGVDGGFAADPILEIQNDVKEIYQAGCVWLIKRNSWGKLITLKDSVGNYLLQQQFQNSLLEQNRLIMLGKQVRFADDMPAIATDSLSLAYGNFGVGYTIVDKIGFRTLRDPFTEKPFIKFYTTKRVGGDVTNYEAIKIMPLSA